MSDADHIPHLLQTANDISNFQAHSFDRALQQHNWENVGLGNQEEMPRTRFVSGTGGKSPTTYFCLPARTLPSASGVTIILAQIGLWKATAPCTVNEARANGITITTGNSTRMF